MTATSEKKIDKPDGQSATTGTQDASSGSQKQDAPFTPKRWPIYAWSLFWVGWIGFLFFMMVTRTRSGLPL